MEQADRSRTDRPEIAASNIQCEIADRTRAINAGGIGAAHLLVKRLGLDQAINEQLDLLKVHLPYHESDHILNIAYNLLAGNSRLEHLELLRNDEGYLDALGATRIPDPTTAGDFCRRFDVGRIDTLQELFNDARVRVWSEQPAEFFAVATIDVDGTTVETTGECKQGMDINYKNQWGYMVQAVTLANTGEPLYVVNRPGNRPSHEEAAAFLDRAVALCRRAGFQQVRLRGDTDFSRRASRPVAERRREGCVRYPGDAEPVRSRGESAAKRLERAIEASQVRREDRTSAAADECQAAGRGGAEVHRHPTGQGARGRVPVSTWQVRS